MGRCDSYWENRQTFSAKEISGGTVAAKMQRFKQIEKSDQAPPHTPSTPDCTGNIDGQIMCVPGT